MNAALALEDCPICSTSLEFCQFQNSYNDFKLTCPACGDYFLDQTITHLSLFSHKGTWWNKTRRAALAHLVRARRDVPTWQSTTLPYVHRELLDEFEKKGITLPTKFTQVDNAIRYLAQSEIEDGEPPFETPLGLWALVGCANSISMGNLFMDMADVGYVASNVKTDPLSEDEVSVLHARLSLAGWQRWEDIRKGDTTSIDGFIAMQFGDPRLDAFIRDVIQTRVKAELGVEVRRVDSPDVIRAGLIDNIMREAIEDAAFVLVELSHGNRGAYWEAGLAEGLGKPVIYLCEQAVWDNPSPEQKVHFDVKHRTTVMWDEANPDLFVQNLIATIKNSLRTAERGKDKAG